MHPPFFFAKKKTAAAGSRPTPLVPVVVNCGGHRVTRTNPAAPPRTTASRRHLERPQPAGRLRVTTACHHLGWGFKGEKGNRFCVSSTRHHSCTCSMQSIILRCRCLLIHHDYSDAFHSVGPPAFRPHIFGSVASPCFSDLAVKKILPVLCQLCQLCRRLNSGCCGPGGHRLQRRVQNFSSRWWALRLRLR